MKCMCGCGQTTPLAKKTDARRGNIRGQHCRFVSGHTIANTQSRRERIRELHATHSFKEIARIVGCSVHTVRKHLRDKHPRGVVPRRARGHINRHGYVVLKRGGSMRALREHVLIAESVLGKNLPAGAVVHHVNGVRSDNRNENLVICQDTAYHMLLHVRQRALDACGDPDWRKCSFCKRWDHPSNVVLGGGSGGVVHSDCRKAYARAWARARRNKAA